MSGSAAAILSQRGAVLARRMLREYVWRYRRRIILAVLCMVVAAAMTAGNAWLIQPALDEIFVKKDASMLSLIPLAVIAIALINGAASYGQTVLMRFVGQRVIADMQLDMFAHLMRADLSLYHQQASGRLISRFTNDIQMMRHSITTVLTGVAKELLTLIFLVGVMFYQSVELSLLALVGFPLAIFPISRLGRRMRKLSDGTQAQLGEFTAQLDDTFQGARVVKAYGAEGFEFRRAKRTIEQLFTLYFKAARVQAAAAPMMESLGGLAIALVIWYGGYQVMQGVTTPGAFFSFITAMIMVYKPVKVVAGLNTQLQEGLAAANRFFALLDTPASIQDAPDARALEVKGGSISLRDVHFAYPNSERGLHGLSLDIPAGKVAALVGASGSGKSTVMNLLLRFYDADSGEILIDGQPIRQLTLSSLRSAMALVSQDVVLFDDTVHANIAYGREDAARSDVIEAAKAANAHDFISRLPQGYDTMIGPHGVTLSGGQRQRLSIARAMLRDAPIVLLDEATSALDTESERAVQEALSGLMQRATTLVIAHRLSTIRHADIIFVMEEGRIVESGTHDTLLAASGRYHQLYHLQFAGEEAA